MVVVIYTSDPDAIDATKIKTSIEALGYYVEQVILND